MYHKLEMRVAQWTDMCTVQRRLHHWVVSMTWNDTKVALESSQLFVWCKSVIWMRSVFTIRFPGLHNRVQSTPDRNWLFGLVKLQPSKALTYTHTCVRQHVFSCSWIATSANAAPTSNPGQQEKPRRNTHCILTNSWWHHGTSAHRYKKKSSMCFLMWFDTGT